MAHSSGRSTAAEMLLAAENWPSLRDALADASPGLKGEVFELLVREFFQLDARYDFTEVWSTHGEVPRSVLKELNLFGRDVTGIDLVARTQQGRYWAVQCKYHQEAAWSLSRKEATGLIAGKSRARGGFELGLICTTANSRSPNLAGEPNVEYLMGDVWRGLDAAFFARLHAQLRGAAPQPPERKQPRPHQVEALEAITKHFSAHPRGKVIMPCATGKSLVGFWAAERLGARRVLVAVPNLSLVRQLLKDWTEQSQAAGRRPTWAVVCSDDSVADTTSARDLGVKVDTDPKEVAAWLRETKGSDFSVVFTTYQSCKVLAQAAKLAGVTFDLGIFDEAHRTAGREGAPFAYLLDEKNITVERRVFMTATPRIFKGKSRDDVISMDDAAQFGGTAFRMTFLQAMERDIIPNLTIVAVTVASAEVERILKNKLFLRLKREFGDDVIRSEELVAALALRKAMQKYGIRRSLGFNSSRKRCHRAGEIQRLLTEVLPVYRALDVFHVDGEMTSAERDSELRAFETSTHALMTNVKVFVEGVDCPSIDAVLFADPKQSIIEIVQGVGRALRPFKGKTAGYAIIPTVIDDEGVPTDAAYEQLIRVACALGSEDEVILDYFAAVAQGKPWAGARVFEVLGDVEVGLQVDLEQVNRAVAVRTYERTVEWRPFEPARAFARTLGLQTSGEWRKFARSAKRPADVPANPLQVYGGLGWRSMGDWLGTGSIAAQHREYRSFAAARAHVRTLGLKGLAGWRAYAKSSEKPSDIPADPPNVYRHQGWLSIGDWLGTGRVANRDREYRAFGDARSFARALGLRTQTEWLRYTKTSDKPDDIPANPDHVYRDAGWVSLGDWLGTGVVATFNRKYRSFSAARQYARSLSLLTRDDWIAFARLGTMPEDIPAAPQFVYKEKGWSGYSDWLGGTAASLGRRAGQPASEAHEQALARLRLRKYRSFEAARSYARSLGLRRVEEWRQVVKALEFPSDVPGKPNSTYRAAGWADWGDWLGTGRKATARREYRPFDAARHFARGLGLRNWAEWRVFAKSIRLPNDIPRAPNHVYRGSGWRGMGDWLGTGNKRGGKKKLKS